MSLAYLSITKRLFMSSFLLIFFCLAVPTYAQLKPCAVLYKTYKDNQTSNPTLAYESAVEFLKRCPNKDLNVKKFIDAYEKSAYEPTPAKTEPPPEPDRTEGREDSANWVSADDITSNLRAVPARHVLVVSDSCYSGTIQRGLELIIGERSARDRFLQKMQAGKSRTLMASGGNEPVSDGGGDGHSVFARALLTGLTKMDRSSFTASELFRDFVQERVAGKANQTPEYNPLRNSGHESGDFVFIRKAAPKNK